MKKIGKIVFYVLIGAFIIIQFFPYNRPENNPPEKFDFFIENQVPDEISTMIRNACFDCHSQETKYPWYSFVAPVSWLVAGDINDGRHHLDFSNWQSLEKKEKIKILDEIAEEVEDGSMPLEIYIPLHPEAKLNDQDREKLILWAESLAEKVFEE